MNQLKNDSIIANRRLLYLFELEEYPQDGRLAKYEKELIHLLKIKDNEGIIDFSERIFWKDCKSYLESSFKLKIPKLFLNLLNHRAYTDLCGKLDWLIEGKPRTNAIIYGNKSGGPPNISIDFEKHFSFFESTGKPINFLINLIVSYIEELIHSADISKSETDIHQITCDAFEGFAEVKLTDEIKKNRLNYSKKVDETKNSGD